jgi:hypothetical protein
MLIVRYIDPFLWLWSVILAYPGCVRDWNIDLR